MRWMAQFEWSENKKPLQHMLQGSLDYHVVTSVQVGFEMNTLDFGYS